MRPIHAKLLDPLSEGVEQRTLAENEGVVPSTIANRLKRLRDEFGAANMNQVMFMYGMAKGLEAAAAMNDDTLIKHPIGDEVYVNEATILFSRQLRTRADRLLHPPKP